MSRITLERRKFPKLFSFGRTARYIFEPQAKKERKKNQELPFSIPPLESYANDRLYGITEDH